MRCQACGLQNRIGNRYCAACGSEIKPIPMPSISPPVSPVYAATNDRKINPMLLVGIVGTLLLMCLAFTAALGIGYFLGQSASSSTTTSTPVTRTRTPTTTASKPAIGLNTPIEGNNSAFTVTSVEKIKTLALSNGDKRDATKGTWVIVYVTIQNKGKETLALNADDYSLLDSAKVETKLSTGFYIKTFVTDKKLAFAGDKIEAGKTVKAAFGFDVDTNAKGLQFNLRLAGAQVPLE